MSLSGSSPFEALKVSSKQVYMQDMAFITEIKRSHVLSFALIFRYLTVIFFMIENYLIAQSPFESCPLLPSKITLSCHHFLTDIAMNIHADNPALLQGST